MIFQINVLFMISYMCRKKNLCSTNIYFKMSSFKMETLKLMEFFLMVVTSTYGNSKCTWCFQNMKFESFFYESAIVLSVKNEMMDYKINPSI